MIVVDTSVVVRLVVGGRDGAEAARLFRQDPEWAGPAILISGVRRVLLGLVRRGSLTVEQAKAMCDDAALALGGRIVTVPSARVIDAALECGLSAEQAEFVVVARELGVPLATGDRAALSAARDVAIWVGTG
ncbi:MAG: type II toxin-antitoxin system VapC family toxin [Gemmatimonadetes bacterium]|nr:type II toxin-antitoxin system VapC family toxin [Gemmatimonadota bacterium]MYA10599.1 type II toxin-antitoxin system VapC family toxin [Gemmatimonadota bacterium]MYE93135.1 type II toxin-antitoxin system VapC family toxin [Gemmatimonadota bacterium]MYJ12486.1 type II toxin-antitoxin system VapC family toxin [Gemmatimonadota bacterium]